MLIGSFHDGALGSDSGAVYAFTASGVPQPPLAKIAVGAVPQDFGLAQNYPNPFNPSTQISYEIPASGGVSLVIYNSLGQSVRTLVAGQVEAGVFKTEWNGKDDAGRHVSSGVYLYRLVSEKGSVHTRRMLLLK